MAQKHYMLDEVPVVFIIPADDAPDDVADRVLAACRANLPDFKVLRSVHLLMTSLDQLWRRSPRTSCVTGSLHRS
ncbi:MAG: hypothetical protein R2706_08035 [Acidimicrobiales bacterium]